MDSVQLEKETRQETSPPVRLRVRKHGAYQIEFKIDYELASARETRYTVNTYIFIPNTLGVTDLTYSNYDFHRDIQNYVRLRTPIFSLDDLNSSPGSPLLISESILDDRNLHRSQRNQERLIAHIKLVRPVLNASLRAHLREALRRRRQNAKLGDAKEGLVHDLDAMRRQGRAYIERFRQLETRLLALDGIDEIRVAFQFVDEAVSLVYEDALVWAYHTAEKYIKDDEYQRRIGEEILREVEYRKQRDYRSILQENSTNERFLQTTSFLKKYTTSALHLSTSTEREGTTLEQVSFAVAAGLSMVFATIVAFYSQARYGMLTVPMFVALVLAYMFKDRIKEIGRSISEKLIRNLRYDLRTSLYSPDGREKIGYMREKMTFMHHANLPESVRRERERHHPIVSAYDELDEEIIYYSKEVTVKRSARKRSAIDEWRTNGIRDIMRYDIRRYLRKTADPVEQRHMYVDGKLIPVDCHKTYHLEFVTEYRSWQVGESPHCQHTIVYIDRNGITNLEDVD